MKCSVCRRDLDVTDKRFTFVGKPGETMNICSSCIARGTFLGSGSVIFKDGRVLDPILAFDGSAEAREIAGEEGWVRAGYTIDGKRSVVIITKHWEMAQKTRYFSNGWVKDGSLGILECFRRSCRHIKADFGLWVSHEGMQ